MDFNKTLKSVEDAVYEVMIWVLLMPKTFWMAMVNPRYAIGEYVTKEWEKDPDKRFDDYLSPVLLWLLMTVVPFSLILVFAGDLGIDHRFSDAFTSDNLLKAAFYMMIIPFIYIVAIEMRNKEPIRRSTLKRAFYKHCYALTPGMIITVLSTGLAFIPTVGLLFIAPALVALPFYEAFVFQSELNAELRQEGQPDITYKKAFAVAIKAQIFLLLFGLPLIFSAFNSK